MAHKIPKAQQTITIAMTPKKLRGDSQSGFNERRVEKFMNQRY
jgi:hypothetical protein